MSSISLMRNECWQVIWVGMVMKAVWSDRRLAVHNRQYTTAQLGRIDSVCQAPVFGGRRRPDIRFLGPQRMIDTLIVHRVLKIPDTQGCSFYFTVLFFSAVTGGKQREAGERIGSSPKSELINRHVSHNGCHYHPPRPTGTCRGTAGARYTL